MADVLTGRLNFRVNEQQERALRQAAALTGESVTGFVLSSAVKQAHELLEQATRIELSTKAFDRFVADLAKPAVRDAELERLIRRRSRIPNP